LLYPLLQLLKNDPAFELQIIATAIHLSPEFGLTINEIEQDGFHISEKVEMLLSADTNTSIVKSVGLAMISCADVFKRLNPDLLVILGDRFEMLAFANSAYLMNIPIAHIAGGETTEGAVDEGIRHSITKMASLHFASTDIYQKRILQLGENPDFVFNTGALGLDNIRQMNLYSKEEVEQLLGISLAQTTALVTFHPETMATVSSTEQFSSLIEALEEFKEMSLVFTMPNCDAGGREIKQLIDAYVIKNPNARVFNNLGQKLYLSTLKYVDIVIGNSSSGIVEVPFMKIPTVNIGERQSGRIMTTSIINAACNKKDIVAAITTALDQHFVQTIQHLDHPYGDGTASEKMLNILKLKLDEISIRKRFFDL
jgi:GDP/UDP-N,N'-diacetylbacillosamine 2-epimerase (hydrolysing)